MGFEYKKNRSSEENGSFWTSYSDLFLGMSVVFLLLYVTASLRQGTNGIQQQIQNEKLQTQVKDLKNQLKMYDSVKKDYLKNEAKPEDEKLYNELMDKLTLLKEDAKNEKDRLLQESMDNNKKEKALNQYQQMVRNIVNANLLAKTKLNKREDVIGKQDVKIDTQNTEIGDLESDVAQKEQLIAQNEQKITDANEKLDQRLKELKHAYKSKQMTEKAYERKVEALKEANNNKVAELNSQKESIESELANTKGKLGQVVGELNKTQGKLVNTEGKLGEVAGKLEETKGQLGQVAGKLGQVSGQLAQTKGQLGQVSGELANTKGKLGQVVAEKEGLQAGFARKFGELKNAFAQKSAKDQEQFGKEIAAREGALKDSEGLLAKARAETDARKQIAREIKAGFEKVGVMADVNEKTGEVLLNFGDAYFDRDSAQLKEKMKEVLNKAMPVYSKSLLGNKKVADKISAVEIIGFASPTYKGKYVDPKNIGSQEGKNAIDYNLDLSYGRARSIFQYVFDENKLSFEHQKDMLPLIKVTGRSFLAEKIPESRTPSSGKSDFCSTHDCKKAQRVIIRFSFEDKK